MHQYWRHATSGDIYAVQIEGGDVTSACGPLYYTEVTQANLESWNFNNDPELVADLNTNWNAYSLHEGILYEGEN